MRLPTLEICGFVYSGRTYNDGFEGRHFARLRCAVRLVVVRKELVAADSNTTNWLSEYFHWCVLWSVRQLASLSTRPPKLCKASIMFLRVPWLQLWQAVYRALGCCVQSCCCARRERVGVRFAKTMVLRGHSASTERPTCSQRPCPTPLGKYRHSPFAHVSIRRTCCMLREISMQREEYTYFS